jgi:hypothetical protein
MTTRPTLLAQLAGVFSHQPETVGTQALGYILSGSEVARHALRDLLQSVGTDVGPIARVRTEATGGEGERPDLVCFDRSGGERLLIEAKFWAGLTSHQPVTYLRRLSDHHQTALLVVAPFLRFETLWPELTRRVSQAEDIELSGGDLEREVRWAMAGAGRRLMLTSWRRLLDSLASATEAAGDMQTANDVRQLQGLANQQDSDAFLPLRPEQMGLEVPRLILHLVQLVDDVCSRLFQTEWAARNRMQRRWEGGHWQYLNLGGLNAWFGLSFEIWRDYRETPLWFGFQESAWRDNEEEILHKLEPLRLKEPPEFDEAYGVIPIFVRAGAEYDVVLDDVVGQLRDIADLLRVPLQLDRSSGEAGDELSGV